MALLTVLLLVAVMAAVCVVMLDDVRFSVRRASNVQTTAQAQWHALGAEVFARRQIARLNSANMMRTPLEPHWNGRVFDFPIEEGTMRVVVSDGQACFNLNSLVQGEAEALTARPEGMRQFVALARALDVPEGRAAAIGAALTDWLDSDQTPSPGGAEDGAYGGQAVTYRTGGTLLPEVSELRAVRGVDAETYARLRPHLCALPTTALSPINVNTLGQDRAALLVMLLDGRLSLPAAQRIIAGRPVEGWNNINEFWAQPALRTLPPGSEAYDQVNVRTRFFNFRADVAYAGAKVVRTSLLTVDGQGRVRPVIQRWTADE